MRQPGSKSAACLVLLASLATGPNASAASEIKLDRDHLATVLSKLPKAPFEKVGQYRGTVEGFTLVGISPRSRELVATCSVVGEFDENEILATLRKSKPPLVGPPAPAVWRPFRFDVKVAINVEPGREGSPALKFKVLEVKRKELSGMVGSLAKVMGAGFDQIVTAYADKKANQFDDQINAQVLKKISMFKDYGMLCGVDYFPTHVVMLFDVTRFRLKGVVGYVFTSPEPGTVPLYRWHNPRKGDHFYTTSDREPASSHYQSEGIACHVFPQRTASTTPLIRYRGKNECFYTTSKDVEALKKVGYKLDGIACFVLATQAPNSVPLYQFIDPVRQLHFYTTHPKAEFAR